MKIFDLNNPRHIAILKEELSAARRLKESFDADAIWDSMSIDDRKSALYVAKSASPDDLINGKWDDIPADEQDLIDLGPYDQKADNRPAGSDQGGRTNVRAIGNFIKTMTVTQSYDLLLAIHKLSKKRTTGNWNPNDAAGKGAWLDAERQAGRSSGLD